MTVFARLIALSISGICGGVLYEVRDFDFSGHLESKIGFAIFALGCVAGIVVALWPSKRILPEKGEKR